MRSEAASQDDETVVGRVTVPAETWERMLEQLEHLRETLQQLAEARERAARAKTEAELLRERVQELRAELERVRGSRSAPEPGDTETQVGVLAEIEEIQSQAEISEKEVMRKAIAQRLRTYTNQRAEERSQRRWPWRRPSA